MLESAFAAYAQGDLEQGKEQLGVIVTTEAMFVNISGLITPIRNYATRLLNTPNQNPIYAVTFMEALFASLPESMKELENFRNSELAGVWIDVAFRAYSLGQSDIVRRALTEALRRQPGYLLNRGVLSIGMEAILGKRAASTFRDAKPNAVARRITLWRRHVILERYLASHPVRKLHIGCGGFLLPGWLNSDLSPFNRGGVVYIDAAERLPFADNTLDFVFSEHFIEHLTYAQGYNFLSECRRVLKPHGVCRLATPNLEFLVQAYSDKVGQYESYNRARFDQWVGGSVYTRALVLNNAFRNWGHQCLYDIETLSTVLKNVGFRQVESCSVGASQHTDLNGLEQHGAISDPQFNNLETMVLEASK